MKRSKLVSWAVCSLSACLMVIDFVRAQQPDNVQAAGAAQPATEAQPPVDVQAAGAVQAPAEAQPPAAAQAPIGRAGARGFGNRGGRGGRGASFTRYQLATLAEVQGELKLTDEQKKLATETVTKATEEQGNLFGAGGEPAELQTKLSKIYSELTDKFVATLDDAQKARMHGLFVQANENSLATVLQDPLIAKALSFNEDQTTAITKAAADSQAALLNAIGDQDAMAKARSDGDAALMKVLTEVQSKWLTELKGKELAMDTTSLRGRRGAGFAGAGNRRAGPPVNPNQGRRGVGAGSRAGN